MSPFASVTLLATDGSREAEHAARMAGELSRTLGSELHAVYVEPMPAPSRGPRPLSSIRKTKPRFASAQRKTPASDSVGRWRG
jgi:hypothetical protein